jgi:hypothetical protein
MLGYSNFVTSAMWGISPHNYLILLWNQKTKTKPTIKKESVIGANTD